MLGLQHLRLMLEAQVQLPSSRRKVYLVYAS